MATPSAANPNIFYLPDLGEGLDEAELIEWCVHVGQQVKENDTLAKMETAKALVEVPSPRDGVIAALHGTPGQAIKVGTPLVTYRDGSPVQAAPVEQAEARADVGTVVGNLASDADQAPETGKILATPAVRRIARESGVDLQNITGTGVGGRITAQDVQAAAGSVETEHAAQPAATRPATAPSTTLPATDSDTTRTPLRGVRRTIAEHLHHSITHAVHYTVMDEADVTALEHLRRKLVAASNEKITLLPFVAAAVCRVLTGQMGLQFTRLNSTVDDDRQEIVQHKSVHLGIATDTESGLMVPVVRDANKLGVLEMGRKIMQLARAARDRSIPREQLAGSTFTISNFGSIAGRFATPIINYPEAGILAVGRAREGVVVRDGMLGVGRLLPLSLSADHRVIDGATASTALAKIISLLQSPEELLAPTL